MSARSPRPRRSTPPRWRRSSTGPGRCMLPAAAYLDDAVLAWERTHLFADAWVCAGRAADLAAVGARRAVEVGDDAVLLVRGDDGVLRGFFNVCQHRAHELAPCGVDERAPLDPLPVPRVALRARRHAAVDAALRRARRLRPGRRTALVPVRVEEWHGWIMVNAQRRRARRSTSSSPASSRTSPATSPSGSSSGRRTPTSWRRTGSSIVENYQECFHCPNIHPELCRVSPSTSGENHVGHDGIWVGGWQDLMPHAVTMSLTGASPTVPLPRAARRGPPADRLHRAAARTCWSACTPTT